MIRVQTCLISPALYPLCHEDSPPFPKDTSPKGNIIMWVPLNKETKPLESYEPSYPTPSYELNSTTTVLL